MTPCDMETLIDTSLRKFPKCLRCGWLLLLSKSAMVHPIRYRPANILGLQENFKYSGINDLGYYYCNGSGSETRHSLLLFKSIHLWGMGATKHIPSFWS